jgi:hypothetical protein
LGWNRSRKFSVGGLEAENRQFLDRMAAQSERDRGRFAGRGSVAGNHAVCRHFRARRKGLGPGLRTTGGSDGIFSQFVPRTYPYNPASRHVQEHAKIQLRLGVALEWTPEMRARDDRAEKYGGKRAVGSAVRLVEHSGSRSPEHSGFRPRALRCRPWRGWGSVDGGRLINWCVTDLWCAFSQTPVESLHLVKHISSRRHFPQYRQLRKATRRCDGLVRLFQRLSATTGVTTTCVSDRRSDYSSV